MHTILLNTLKAQKIGMNAITNDASMMASITLAKSFDCSSIQLGINLFSPPPVDPCLPPNQIQKMRSKWIYPDETAVFRIIWRNLNRTASTYQWTSALFSPMVRLWLSWLQMTPKCRQWTPWRSTPEGIWPIQSSWRDNTICNRPHKSNDYPIWTNIPHL